MDSTPPTLPTRLPYPFPNSGASNASKTTSDSSSAGTPFPHIRSCTFCRSRKVKCNRQQPCASCLRAGTECTYPPGPGRAPKRPRQALDPRVLDRLSRLESLVKQVNKGQVPESVAPPESMTTPVSNSEDASSGVEQQLGRLIIDDTRTCYVSNISWASLGDEVCHI